MEGSKAALCGLLLAMCLLQSTHAYGPPQRKKNPRPLPSEASPIPSFSPEGSEHSPSPVPSAPGSFQNPIPVAPEGAAPGQGGDYWWKAPGGPFSGNSNPQAGCANGCEPSVPPSSHPVVGCGGGPSSSCGGVPKPAPSGPACGYPGAPGCGGGGARPVAPIPPNTGCGHPGAPPCGGVKPSPPPDYSSNPFLCSLAGGCKDVQPASPPHGGRPVYPGSPGTPGSPGSPGFPGTPGSPGSHGSPGSPGFPGTPGSPGSHGGPGSPGFPGTPGSPGSHGSPGSPGYPGTPGSPGSHGSPGSPGFPGTPGSPGSHGGPGSPGVPGYPGTPGSPGSHGSPGSPGFPGTPGKPGTPGHGGSPNYPGSPGSPGFPGSPGVPGAPSHGVHPRPIPGTPTYPSGVNPSPQYPGSQPFSTTQRPYTGPLNTTPHPGCAAALKCVQIQYCTADGVMVDYPVSLTREQIENRVPLSDCVNPDTGVIGKCCRDPNYKDPWPDMNTHPVGHDTGSHGGPFPKPPAGGTFPKPVGSGTFPSPGVVHPGTSPSFPGKPAVPPTSGTPGFPQRPGSVGGQYPGSEYEQQQQGQFPPLGQGSPKPGVGITHPGPGGIPQTPYPQPSPGINQQPGHGGSPATPFPQNPPPSFGSNQQKPGFPQQPPPAFGQPGTQTKPYPTGPSSPGSHTPSFPSQPSVPSPQPSFPSQPSVPSPQPSFPSQPSVPSSQPSFPSQPSQSQLPPTHSTFPSSPSGANFPNKPPSSGFPNQPSGSFPSTPNGEPFPSQVSVGTFPTQPVHSDSQNVPYGTCGIRRGHPTNPDVGPTQFGEFPWHAMVLARANASRSALCSGVIISEKAILTAAHCVAGLLPADIFVRVAEWRPWSDSKTEEPVAVIDAGVIAIAKHPSFELNSLFSDLAILFLSDHLPAYGPAIEPICIPGQPGAGTPIGGVASPSSCLATSWGKTTLSGADHGPLYKVGLNIIGHAPCEQQLRQTHLGKFFILHQSFQCSVFYPPEQALPQVDDGSPLVCQTTDGNYILQGIGSWTIGSGPSHTSVFALIDYIWIRETLSRPVEEFFPKQEDQNELIDTSKKPGFSQGYGRK